MKAVILAGGLGTRLREETDYRPKPMVDIGGHPILWHIMKIYAHYNVKEFIVCAGYRGDVIRQYFLNYEALSSDFTVHLGQKDNVRPHGFSPEDWTVTVAETGHETMTGGRVLRIKPYLNDDNTFMVTYGDGLADVDIDELLAYHRSHGRLATMTCVQPPSRFGIVEMSSNGRVRRFREKPHGDDWVNGGFFVFETGVFDYLHGDCTVLEREPLVALAADGQLMAFRHAGFFQPMDTFREYTLLNEMWEQRAPWRVWTS